jgi:hypothetical protein
MIRVAHELGVRNAILIAILLDEDVGDNRKHPHVTITCQASALKRLAMIGNRV